MLSDLERTTAAVRWSDEPADADLLYVLFSRSGYSDDVEQTAAARSDVRLFGLADVLSVL
ncbi:hypothetical protein [Halorhabdus rudnickae]|uniref:hypothetical protein n=1 Tax=Halorhabdus rudnickae TaxID=1775544 RepID=UPI001FCEADFE|nr:hypothetical protein [Halorhabdus rudnickae]